MTKPLRIEFAGAVYHLTSRGNAKQAIFLDEEDFADFLRVLCQMVKRDHFLLHAYCLMNNHDHQNGTDLTLKIPNESFHCY